MDYEEAWAMYHLQQSLKVSIILVTVWPIEI